MNINVKEIAKLNWKNDWSGNYSLLTCSLTGEFYFKSSVNLLGKGINNILFIYKNGITTCYLGKSDKKIFGEYLTKKAITNNQFLDILAKRLKEETDKTLDLIKKPISYFLDINNYLIFEKSCKTYQPFHVSVKALPNYLPLELAKKYTSILEDARKYSEPVYDEIEKLLRGLAKIIGDKERYEIKLILCLYKDELANYLQTKSLPTKEILEKRYKLSGLFFQEGKRTTLSKDIEELETEIAKSNGLILGKVKGKSSFPGIVKGTCRIIQDPLNFKEFNQGDILVTSMTRPEFIPLMKKAAAIITDAGGILCHAAITSRELKIPCVIGTETATKSFKDGDVLEVNAEEGTATTYNTTTL
jgi:phosphoenolpyruvate synthase/pyruvate phosphate dikinase